MMLTPVAAKGGGWFSASFRSRRLRRLHTLFNEAGWISLVVV